MQHGWTEKKKTLHGEKSITEYDQVWAHGIIDETKISTISVILISRPVIILTFVVYFMTNMI